MSEIGNILSAFADAINTNELAWSEVRIGPVNLDTRENVCYIEPGESIEFEERGTQRIHTTTIILSAQRTATNRTDLSGIDYGADAINAVLDAVDSNKTLQNLCQSLEPMACDLFYDDKEGMQSIKLQLTYSARFVRARQRAR